MKLQRSAILKARQLVKEGFLALDTETTGVRRDSEIVEIAVLDQNGATVFHSLVKPSKPIPAQVIAIHGITNEMVQDAPTFSEIAIPLLEVLSNKNIVAHNAYFDRKMIEYEFSKYNFCLNAHWECTMLLSTERYKKWNKLNEAMAMFGLKSNGVAHRALSDAECCRQILIALSEQ
ncbi:3'-5' exonuclease [Acinetobacter colistiniresistens]|uniref:3'-5' exonuclease n=1 Tax=Acinetobacter colistiniresistens TaxID=280145 RepID=UPI001250507D|nr:3'-5' exonuclease [Acinetobacter colistiniresistens]